MIYISRSPYGLEPRRQEQVAQLPLCITVDVWVWNGQRGLVTIDFDRIIYYRVCMELINGPLAITHTNAVRELFIWYNARKQIECGGE